jgi:hypothetical protein
MADLNQNRWPISAESAGNPDNSSEFSFTALLLFNTRAIGHYS